ncbi:MAG: hypothetical protein V4616_07750 [Bacteroidota bacterium]
MEKNWVVVFTDTFLPKVELVKAMLLEHEIPTIIFNQQDSAHRTFGEIQLMVDRDNVLKALHLIQS